MESGWCTLSNVHSAAEDNMTSGKYLFEPGDVLYSKLRPYLRKVAVAPFRGLCSADMYPLRPKAGITDPHFLAWLLLTDAFTSYADEQSRRSRMPKLNREQLFAWETTLPPLQEQHGITARLRDQLAEVTKARAALETQLDAAQGLPAAHLRSILDSPTAQQWPIRRLGEVCDIQLGKMLSPKSKTGANPRPYLRNADVQWGRFALDNTATMDFSEAEAQKFTLRPGDLLVCEGGEPGRAAVWSGQITPCYYQKALHRLRPHDQAVDPFFVMFRLWLGALKNEFTDSHAKTTIAHLPAIRLANLPLRVPPLAQQKHLVTKLQSDFSEALQLQTVFAERLAALNHLPAALLREAFAGRI
jgi:type I restriction enzyme, S subunit